MPARSAADPVAPAHGEDDAFAALKALIVGRTGHFYYDDKDDQLRERIARRMAAAGIADQGRYLDRLRGSDAGAGGSGAGEAEWRRLETELTIKETFFFRFAEQFAALRTAILPGLIAARGETRRLRIWSAGCSTGAEPYSIATIVRDLLGDAIGDWHVSILGTDLDEAALAAAREASYGAWSLRTMAPAERERLFTAEGPRWRLRPAYRGMVRFERLNIFDLLGGAAPLQLSDYDLILCRNMLIYFHPDAGERLVAALGRRLADDGWLLLGHAEAGLAAGSGLAGIERGGVIAYRPDAGTVAQAPEPGTETGTGGPRAAAIAVKDAPLATRRPARVAAEPRAIPPAAAPDTDAADALTGVRRLLDGGDTAAAAAAIAELRADGRDEARLHYLDAIRAMAEADPAVAERALRGALYLDGGFAMAHYLLARQLADTGRIAAARRSLANAAAALAAGDPAAPVPEGDGWSVADLRDAVRARLAELDRR